MVAEASLAEFDLDAPAPDGPTTASDPEPSRAVHTGNFPALLRQLGASLLVTTYQAGKLVMVRDEGDHLNTHFRTFRTPMGMALGGSPLAVGTTVEVWEFADVPALTALLDPPGTIRAGETIPNNRASLPSIFSYEEETGSTGLMPPCPCPSLPTEERERGALLPGPRRGGEGEFSTCLVIPCPPICRRRVRSARRATSRGNFP
jgi:hypothetical protein